MLARYLGNKTSILPPLLETMENITNPGGHVVDALSGSLAVSLALKAEGYRVTANDINLFSAVFADAYLIPTEVAVVELGELLTKKRISSLRS